VAGVAAAAVVVGAVIVIGAVALLVVAVVRGGWVRCSQCVSSRWHEVEAESVARVEDEDVAAQAPRPRGGHHQQVLLTRVAAGEQRHLRTHVGGCKDIRFPVELCK